MKKLWVIKAGSQLITEGGIEILKSWARQVLSLRTQSDVGIIWVTSGAVSTAKTVTSFSKSRTDWTLSERQALSAVGQPLLMERYKQVFSEFGIQTAQILLTYTDLASREQKKNFQNTIHELLRWGVVPIINENDAVATQELKFGDNDTLSAKVARHTKSHQLIILTNVDGLFDDDPTVNPEAKLVTKLSKVTPELLKKAKKASGSKDGTGGIFSKLKAAKEAADAGIPTVLVNGNTQDILLNLKGTFISARKK